MKKRGKNRWRWLVWLLACAAASLVPVLALRFVDPPTSAFMLARQWQMRNVPGWTLQHAWVPLEEVSPDLLIALVAAEDQNFPYHHGFDLGQVRSAWQERGGQRALRGASTISQQLARNLFLWSGRSWLRKGLEAWYTLAIEGLWPKRRILELYVNLAEFADGVYGAEAAARKFHGVGAAALGPGQSARLAAVLPSPRRYHVDRPSPRVLQRQAWIEQQVGQLGGPRWLQDCCGNDGRSR